jgi:trehalose 6-phosphate phosphatase
MKQAQTAVQAPTLRKTALFIDFDGIFSRPAANGPAVPPSTLGFLSTLQKKNGGALAIVSGHRVSDLDRMLAPLAFVASGCLGAEMRMTVGGEIYALAEAIPEAVVHELCKLVGRKAHLTFENKVYSACLYFERSTLSDAEVEEELTDVKAVLPRGVKILFTPYGCEIKQHNFNKGSAVRNFFLSPTFKDKMPVYVGNHILDHEAFTAVRAMGGVGMYVGDDYVNPDIDFALKSLEDIQQWLDGI